ncbi:2-(3-amino-3-carboxypropyl)histidine synthase [Acrasis kona]|uniref:2-(3-amino-3-carboxypropyl)histidine synthase n=1 Tax=Acrasis kona TaxID=1008807 RepID=A0AAW2YXV8_9EUKA
MALKRRQTNDDDEDQDYVFEDNNTDRDEEDDLVEEEYDCTPNNEVEVAVSPKKKSPPKNKQETQCVKKKRAKRHIFTDEEEEKLKAAVIRHKREDESVDWKKVSKDVNPKLHYKQVFQHYKRVTLARRNHIWTNDQNIELYHYVVLMGSATNMADISKEFYNGHFPDNQLRHHYENHVKDKKKLAKEYEKLSQEQITRICEKNVALRATWSRPEGLVVSTKQDQKKIAITKHVPPQDDASPQPGADLKLTDIPKYNTRKRKDSVTLSQSPSDEDFDHDRPVKKRKTTHFIQDVTCATSSESCSFTVKCEPVTEQMGSCLFSLLLQAANNEYNVNN